MSKGVDVEKTYLAVYGTLRRGGAANHFMRGARFVGQDEIQAKMYLLGSFPGIRLDDNTIQRVRVDIYEVTPEVLAFCDKYEGYKEGRPDESLFVRKTVKSCGASLEEELYGGVSCFVYEFNDDIAEDRRILSGDWFDEASRLPLSA